MNTRVHLLAIGLCAWIFLQIIPGRILASDLPLGAGSSIGRGDLAPEPVDDQLSRPGSHIWTASFARDFTADPGLHLNIPLPFLIDAGFLRDSGLEADLSIRVPVTEIQMSQDPELLPEKERLHNVEEGSILLSLPFGFDELALAPFASSTRMEDGSQETVLGAENRIALPGDSVDLHATYATGQKSMPDDPSVTKDYFALGIEYLLENINPELYFLSESGSDPELVRDRFRDDRTLLPFSSNHPILGLPISNDLDPDQKYAGYSADYHGVGFRLRDITLLDRFSNDLSLLYDWGLADPEEDPDLFNEEQSLIKVSLDTRYAVYEQLAAMMQIGMLRFSEDDDPEKSESAWKMSLGLRYDF